MRVLQGLTGAVFIEMGPELWGVGFSVQGLALGLYSGFLIRVLDKFGGGVAGSGFRGV